MSIGVLLVMGMVMHHVCVWENRSENTTITIIIRLLMVTN